jgi:F0F1-type ATP synthase membrane subunit a
MLFLSPLEQFSINKFLPIFIGNFDFSITNSSVLVLFVCCLGFMFYNFACTNAKLIPGV